MNRRMVYEKLDGYVYCDHLGEVHRESLDPYGYGPPAESDEQDMRCRPSHHRPVFVEAAEEIAK